MDERLLESVDDFQEFLFVSELDSRLSELVAVNNILELGRSAKGHPILCAKLGSGKRNALIFGFPHPNEPVGSLTCISLIKILSVDEKLRNKFTWYIIPCADPDGATLNEGWFRGKFGIKKYIHNFYRSREALQTDWTFPIEYKDYKFNNSPPNVVALKKLIEEIKPDLVFPIHNSGFGGSYFYITKSMPEKYYDEVIALCKSLSIPLDFGEPEVQFMKALKKPFYLNFDFEESYEYYRRLGRDPKKILEGGTDSIGYSKKLNPRLFGLIVEVPYIYDPRVLSNTHTNKTRRECLTRALKLDAEILGFISRAINHSEINKSSIFYDLLNAFIREDKAEIMADKANLKKKEYTKAETIAEEFSASILTRFNSALILGELRRLLLESKMDKEQEKLLGQVENKIDELVSYIDGHSDYKALPIKNLVQLQLGFLLISLDYL